MRWIGIALVLMLAACAAPVKKKPGEAAVEERPVPQETARTHGLAGEEGLKGTPLEMPGGLLAERVIYFDLDSTEIKEEYRPLLAALADYLSAHPEVKVRLEGHADERGSREYNLALGERRAMAVRDFLVLLGVSPDQIQVVSYGEERPAVPGHDEEAWSKNRRVEIKYLP